MRIYKSDGSFVDKPEDTEFGWYLKDVIIDENVPDYEQRNQDLVLKSKSFIQNINFETSFDFCDDAPAPAKKIERFEPKIKIQRIKSVIDSKLSPEGVVQSQEQIDVPSQTNMVKLIDPCNVESKILLSVIHFAKYKNLTKDITNLGDVRNSSKIRLVRKNSMMDLREELRTEIENYDETKEENMMSLMMELVLNDLRCDLSDIAECPSPVLDSSGVGNSIQTESSATNSLTVVRNEHCGETFDSISIIDKSIDKICEETYDIHVKIAQIKQSFHEDELKVNALIEDAQTLEKSLRETKFLNDLLHFLNGDLARINLKLAPFKILNKQINNEEMNLIV